MTFNKGDKVVVKGLHLAFVFHHYTDDGLARLFIEGEGYGSIHSVVFAKPDVLLPNNLDTLLAEGWIKPEDYPEIVDAR